MNKKEKVLNHLKSGKSITSIEAIELYGATRLSAIIFKLKRDGYLFRTENVTFIDRFGSKSHYSKYTLVGKWEKHE